MSERQTFHSSFGLCLITLDWVEVSVWRSMLNVVARLSNRVFVGAPLCEYHDVRGNGSRWRARTFHALGRDKEYLELAIDFASDLNSDGTLINFLPKFIKP